MPITVSCPACGSRFSLSDDLYRRRVAGSLVKVKCRNCRAEIAVDATEPATTTSHEPQRKHPMPPRPKAITQMGLGTPPPPSGLETASSLPDDDAQRTPLPLNATITPLPALKAATAAPISVDPDSLWADEETIAINLKTKQPVAHTAAVADETEELEQLEAEEIPVSSSGAPTLDALTLEAGGAHVPHGRQPADEFLLGFHASGDAVVGAPTIDLTGINPGNETPTPSVPTIDVTSFASELEPAKVDVAPEEQELEYRPRRGATTVPQFDMNAVLSTPSADEGVSSAASTPVPVRKPAPNISISEVRPRERRHVVPPQEVASTQRKARRSRAPLWIGLLAAAGAVGAGFGYHERMKDEERVAQSDAPRPVPSPVVNTQAALPAEAITPATNEAAPPTTAVVPELPAAPVAPVAQTVTAATTRNVAPNTVNAVKNTPIATGNSSSTTAEPAVEKPIVAERPVEAHNAPPAAAPDTDFDRDAARNALTSAAAQASSCRKEGDPSGTASLTITFAPSGRVTSAQIQGPPFSGTATGGCIANTMRRASVPAFSGDYVTVSKTIVIQ